MFDYQGVSGLSRMNEIIPIPDLKAHIIGLNKPDCPTRKEHPDARPAPTSAP